MTRRASASLDDRLDQLTVNREAGRIHEAAHALTGDVLGLSLPARIVVAGDRHENARDAIADVDADPVARIQMLLAGGAAEALFGFRNPWPGSRRDLRQAIEIARAHHLDEGSTIDAALKSVGRLVALNRGSVGAMADLIEEAGGILETSWIVRTALAEANGRAGRPAADPARTAAAADRVVETFYEQGRRDVQGWTAPPRVAVAAAPRRWPADSWEREHVQATGDPAFRAAWSRSLTARDEALVRRHAPPGPAGRKGRRAAA